MTAERLCEIIGSGAPFAMFRLPFSDVFSIVAQEDRELDRAVSLTGLNHKKGFLLHPFAPSKECPIFMVRPDYKADMSVGEMEAHVHSCGCRCHASLRIVDLRQSDYMRAFHRFHEALESGKFQKLVLSRRQEADLLLEDFGALEIVSIFLSACRKYPRMMVYLTRLSTGKIWIGCTPEILLSGSNSHCRTVALAGTMTYTGAAYTWSEKNCCEQRMVAEYIRETLSPVTSIIEEEGPFTSRAGQLIHLKSEFHFSPLRGVGLYDIIGLLHPTPAVCGLPKTEAREFIIGNEGYDREYYSGIVGYIDERGETHLYVNLRCAQVGLSRCESGAFPVQMYAGGGLLVQSDADSEWRETEEKLKTISYVFG